MPYGTARWQCREEENESPEALSVLKIPIDLS